MGGTDAAGMRVGVPAPRPRMAMPTAAGALMRTAAPKPKPAATTVASVIARAQRGEPEAFDELVDCYAGRLCGFFRRMLGRRAEAEDLVQEVFVRVVQTIDRYREDGRFEPWLFRIAANLARDRLRRRVTDGRDDQPIVRDVAHAEPDPLVLREDLDRLQRAMSRLPQAEREVILLRHYGQLQFDEIALLTETPIGTALARAYRGLSKLRGWIESP